MKVIHYIFMLVFFVIITLPLLLLDTKSTISESENRTLAIFPNIITDGVTHFPKLLDNYIGDRFGLKNEAVAFTNNFIVRGTFQRGDVILGEDNWLFYSNHGNNISDFLKINLFSEDEIRHFITNIENRLEWCSANNIKFVFLIAPNKHNIYPENYCLR
ncbi:MAG: hypothetical protein Ta2B_16510 [Termitinemataceae bacterium]|nr:MAG: hypothetical protein Ta2B_16510 [Termitinemataceae bacterium]